MTNKLRILNLLIVASFCILNYANGQANNLSGEYSLLNGKWKLVYESPEKNDYISILKFDDAKRWLTVGTYADTILGYRYRLKKNILLLVSESNTTKNKIILLTKDSLVFSNFLRMNTKQVFLRIN